MPTLNELEREQGWIHEILERDTLSERSTDHRGGCVCQVCGEIGVFLSRRERIACHSGGGDFEAFSAGHRDCAFPVPGIYLRPWRWCEFCRTPVEATPEHRAGLFWRCGECRVRIEASGHRTEAVLGHLAARRYAEHERVEFDELAQATARDWENRDGITDVLRGPGVEPPPSWLPEGLHYCGECGIPAGTTWAARRDGELFEMRSSCWCGGPACVECGEIRSWRPISDHYDPEEGHWWHVSYVAGMRTHCEACRGPQ